LIFHRGDAEIAEGARRAAKVHPLRFLCVLCVSAVNPKAKHLTLNRYTKRHASICIRICLDKDQGNMPSSTRLLQAALRWAPAPKGIHAAALGGVFIIDHVREIVGVIFQSSSGLAGK
jgi:hypothetical protein